MLRDGKEIDPGPRAGPEKSVFLVVFLRHLFLGWRDFSLKCKSLWGENVAWDKRRLRRDWKDTTKPIKVEKEKSWTGARARLRWTERKNINARIGDKPYSTRSRRGTVSRRLAGIEIHFVDEISVLIFTFLPRRSLCSMSRDGRGYEIQYFFLLRDFLHLFFDNIPH